MKVVYIQSIGGASGDMLLGAFLDLGVPLDALVAELNNAGICGFALSTNQDTRCEIRGTKLDVALDDPKRLSPHSLLAAVSGSSLALGVKGSAEKVLTALWQAESRVHGEPPEALELEELGTIDTLVDVVGVAICLDYLGVEQVYAAGRLSAACHVGVQDWGRSGQQRPGEFPQRDSGLARGDRRRS